jgi:hypothetical protein
MPDLSTRSIGSWLDHEELGAWNELPDAARRAELDPNIETAIVALGVALDEAYSLDPKSLSKRLRTDPARTTFQSILAQLGSARLLRLLDWMTEPNKPYREALLAGLFTPKAGDASEAIQKAVQFASRRALLARITADVRMSSLVICAIEHKQDRAARKVI